MYLKLDAMDPEQLQWTLRWLNYICYKQGGL
jgi:hypothetical protein